MRRLLNNLTFQVLCAISLGVIVVLVTLALFQKIPLTLGVVGHEGSTLVVVLNSLRLLFGRAPAWSAK